MKKTHYSTEEEIRAAVIGCASTEDAGGVIQKAKEDAGDFGYLNLRYVISTLDESLLPRMTALFSEADPRFREFAASGCDQAEVDFEQLLPRLL